MRKVTRDRVLAAIDTLGYRVSQAARQMRTGRSRLIAVRIDQFQDGINGSVLDRFLHGLAEAATPAGYRVILYAAADDAAEIVTFDDLLAAYELDAFVLTSTHHNDTRTSWLAERGVPFVTFGRPWDALDSHPWVDVEGSLGTEEATRHLLAEGHQRIAFLGWPAGSGVGDDRRAGWERAIRNNTATGGPALATSDGIVEGVRATSALLSGAEPPTAVVCASDSLALGALRASVDAGADLAVTGFDDTPVASAVGLTSVSQPLEEAAAGCVRLLAEILDRPDQPRPPTPPTILLPPRLVVRRSQYLAQTIEVPQ